MNWPLRRLNEIGFVGRGKSKHRPRGAGRILRSWGFKRKCLTAWSTEPTIEVEYYEGNIMTLTKSYITDETGKVTSVILDYATYQHFEELLLEQGLLSAMEEVDDEETVAYADVKDLIEAL